VTPLWNVVNISCALHFYCKLPQHKLSIDRGIPEAEDSQQRAVLHQSLAALADLVLDGYQQQLKSLARDDTSSRWAEVNASFERHRSQLIGPLCKWVNVGSVFKLRIIL